MGIHSLSMKHLRRCGLREHQDSSWRLAAFSLCIVLITRQAVTLSVPGPATASLSLTSSPHLPNNGASGSSRPSVLELAVAPTILSAGQEVINAVPEEDRAMFLTYQLALGLRASNGIRNDSQWIHNMDIVVGFLGLQAAHLMDVPIYGNFATDLLQWLMDKFHLSPEDIYNQLRSRSKLLCTSGGVCYDPNELVCYCCPF